MASFQNELNVADWSSHPPAPAQMDGPFHPDRSTAVLTCAGLCVTQETLLRGEARAWENKQQVNNILI